MATLQQLDEEALVRILKEPKNALVKQYAKLFDMDGVHLEFEDAALHAIAHRAVERLIRSGYEARITAEMHAASIEQVEDMARLDALVVGWQRHRVPVARAIPSSAASW